MRDGGTEGDEGRRRCGRLHSSGHGPVIQLPCWGGFPLVRGREGGFLAAKRQANGRCANDGGSCTELWDENASVEEGMRTILD